MHSIMSIERDLRADILALLRQPFYQPMDKVALSKMLKFPSARRGELRALLKTMEKDGLVGQPQENQTRHERRAGARRIEPAPATVCGPDDGRATDDGRSP